MYLVYKSEEKSLKTSMYLVYKQQEPVISEMCGFLIGVDWTYLSKYVFIMLSAKQFNIFTG